jgi:hypothetical protein
MQRPTRQSLGCVSPEHDIAWPFASTASGAVGDCESQTQWDGRHRGYRGLPIGLELVEHDPRCVAQESGEGFPEQCRHAVQRHVDTGTGSDTGSAQTAHTYLRFKTCRGSGQPPAPQALP